MTLFYEIISYAPSIGSLLFGDDPNDHPASNTDNSDGNIDVESLLEEALELGWVDLKNKGHISEEE